MTEPMPLTSLQTLARELDTTRAMLRKSLARQKNIEAQLVYQKRRHAYFKTLTLGYERELGVRKDRGAVVSLDVERCAESGPVEFGEERAA